MLRNPHKLGNFDSSKTPIRKICTAGSVAAAPVCGLARKRDLIVFPSACRLGWCLIGIAALVLAAAPRTVSGQGNSVTTPITPAAEQAVEKGLRFLAGTQHASGAFGSGPYRANVAVTALCGMSFIASGSTPNRGPYGEVVQRALEFVLSRAEPSGYIVSEEQSIGHGPMYGHGFATLFLAEVYGMSPRADVRSRLEGAVRLIVDTQNSDGGWRYFPVVQEADVSVTACQLVALRAARNAGIAVPKQTVDQAVEYIRNCQNRDGGFRYQLRLNRESSFARSAAAVTALYAAGRYDDPAIERGLKYLDGFLPHGRSRQTSGYFYYGRYYVAQAMWQARGERWERWYAAVRDELLRRQANNGGWSDGFICNEYGTAMALLVLQLPNHYLPIFQR